VEGKVRRHGFAVIAVGGGQCAVPGCPCADEIDEPFAYTVGLSTKGLPELVITGLEANLAGALLGQAARLMQLQGPPDDRATDQLGGIPVMYRDVPIQWLAHDPSRLAVWWDHASNEGRRDVVPPDLVQVVWGDAAGRFPGDPDCDPFLVEDQPVLADDPFSYPRAASRAVRRDAARRASRTAS
jgi:hypothetical protein